MIELIGGENSYEAQAELEKSLSKYKAKGFEVLMGYIGKDASLDELLSQISSFGLFGSKKVALIKDFQQAKAQEIEKIENYITSTKEPNLIIHSRQKFDKRTKFYKNIKPKAKIKEFGTLKGQDLASWLRFQIKEMGLKLGKNLENELFLRINQNQYILKNELVKLKALEDENIKITKEVFDEVVIDGSSSSIWELMDLLTSNDKYKALKILDDIKAYYEPEYILALVERQVRLYFIALNLKDRDKLIKFGMHPYVVAKITKQVAKLSKEKILKIYNKMVDMEIALKTGKIYKDLALDLLIITF